jgi:hypothetical protein
MPMTTSRARLSAHIWQLVRVAKYRDIVKWFDQRSSPDNNGWTTKVLGSSTKNHLIPGIAASSTISLISH